MESYILRRPDCLPYIPSERTFATGPPLSFNYTKQAEIWRNQQPTSEAPSLFCFFWPPPVRLTFPPLSSGHREAWKEIIRRDEGMSDLSKKDHNALFCYIYFFFSLPLSILFLYSIIWNHLPSLALRHLLSLIIFVPSDTGAAGCIHRLTLTQQSFPFNN